MARYSVSCMALVAMAVSTAFAEQDCPLPPSLQPTTRAKNIFSDVQEPDLGDAMAETIALHVNVIDNDELTAHLRELGAWSAIAMTFSQISPWQASASIHK
jgi:hypothetical protein